MGHSTAEEVTQLNAQVERLIAQNARLEEQAQIAGELQTRVKQHIFERKAREMLLVEQHARQEERVRLARDLNHIIKQHIFALSMHIKKAHALLDRKRHTDAQTCLAKIDELMDQIQQKLNEVIDVQLSIDSQAKATYTYLSESANGTSCVPQKVHCSGKNIPTVFSSLTVRELQVLQALAQGLTNVEIAAQLVLSEKTVRGYVSNMLSKLHLSDRTQVAVLAWKTGLMSQG